MDEFDNPAAAEGSAASTFEMEESPDGSPGRLGEPLSPTSKKAKKMPRIPGPGLGAVKNKAQEKVIKVKDAAAATAGGALSVAAGAAATAQGAASQVKDLKKFMDLDLEVFNSTEEADRKEMEEDLNNRKKWGGILHPETTTSVLYNQMHVVFLVYMLIVLPVRTAFKIDPSPGTTEFAVDAGIDLIICVDIILNFRKFQKNGMELVTDPKIIKKEYLRGWFIVDFLSVFPFNYIIMIISANTDAGNLAHSTRFIRFMRVARFIRLIKLAKVSQLRDAMRVLKEFLQTVGISPQEVEFLLRMIALVAVMLGIGHLMACMWLHVGRTGLENDEGWMVGSHELARVTGPNGTWIMVEGVYVHEQYVDSFYWAIVTMSSVGYGDLLPTTTNEREICVFVITIGAFLYAYIIGAFSTIMAALDYDNARYDTKMRTVASHLKHFGVDKSTAKRVTRFYEFRFENKLMFADDDIMGELPARLRSEIVLLRYQKTVDRIPFFRGLTEDVVTLICVKFKEFSVLPGDDIIYRGDPYREMLVLTKGMARSVPPAEEDEEKARAGSPRAKEQAKVDQLEQERTDAGGEPVLLPAAGLSDDGPAAEDDEQTKAFKHRFQLDGSDQVIEYPTGSIFGELEFLGMTHNRPTTIRAKSYCELASLHPGDIELVVENCPALKRRLSKYADIRQAVAENTTGGSVDEMHIERVKEEAEENFENEEADVGYEAANLLGIQHQFNDGGGSGMANADTAKMMQMMHEMAHGMKKLDARMERLEAVAGSDNTR